MRDKTQDFIANDMNTVLVKVTMSECDVPEKRSFTVEHIDHSDKNPDKVDFLILEIKGAGTATLQSNRMIRVLLD